MDKRLKFNEPWILQRADPYVYDKDGWFVAAPICHNGRNSLGRTIYQKGVKNYGKVNDQQK